MTNRLDWAVEQTEVRLAPLGRRLHHVRAVGRKATQIGPTVVGEASETLVLAALLHDIGYAPELAVTGFHPLDGARFLRDQGHVEVASLVAHHTGARREAQLRGLPELEAEFPFETSLLQRALTYCDLTVGPDGEPTRVTDRVAEIVSRYGAEHVVSKAVQMGLQEFLEYAAEIEGLLSEPRGSTRSGSR